MHFLLVCSDVARQLKQALQLWPTLALTSILGEEVLKQLALIPPADVMGVQVIVHY